MGRWNLPLSFHRRKPILEKKTCRWQYHCQQWLFPRWVSHVERGHRTDINSMNLKVVSGTSAPLHVLVYGCTQGHFWVLKMISRTCCYWFISIVFCTVKGTWYALRKNSTTQRFWTFWPVIQLVKWWSVSWITDQNVQKLLILAVFALSIASILNELFVVCSKD